MTQPLTSYCLCAVWNSASRIQFPMPTWAAFTAAILTSDSEGALWQVGPQCNFERFCEVGSFCSSPWIRYSCFTDTLLCSVSFSWLCDREDSIACSAHCWVG